MGIDNKIKRTFLIDKKLFADLKVYSSRHAIPYGMILETLIDAFLNEPQLFAEIDFTKYTNKNKSSINN